MSRFDATSLLPPPPPPTKPRRRGCLLPSAAVALFFLVFLRSPPNPPPNYVSLFLSLGSNDTAALHLRALTLHPHVGPTPSPPPMSSTRSLPSPSRLTSRPTPPSSPTPSTVPSPSPRGPAAAPSHSPSPRGPAAEVIPIFFAYSASGSVSAEAVYANYGREEDFAYLASRGVDVVGKVALARYGRIHCEYIVRNARKAGAAAALVYTDPLEYGGAPGEGSFPNTRWLPPTGVQVGSLFSGVGDPTTPMWASSEGCERVSVEGAMGTDDMPGIPALQCPRGTQRRSTGF
ncbi:LOW QUALITY PROTEIN: hypothetical protein BRADI_2g49371v3 [Brachypodium distachyon]|uniref:PA domain-containing protein n=1 Tax=Brachypodium distachyon TaxID=15368 RepID=A0A2K2DEW6_BRADI|nr:LOW QUALITY PROTEIN: hypothetical protein BRADI_2g49371v3 [Brachypodium distachyon]